MDTLGRLYRIYAEANDQHFAGLLPMLPIRIETMTNGRRADTLAYCWLDDYHGLPRYIVVEERHAQTAPWPELRATLLHEMIHVWQGVRGLKVAHGPAFRDMARRLGITARAVD